jgi:putative FmdB family regulatory protein
MPTYAYRCTACGHQFDIFQRFSDDSLTECPECHGLIKRVLHPVGVVFKGSGWYITDSRKPSAGENGGTDKADKTDGKDAKETKTADTTKKSETSDATTAKAKPKAAATADD